MAEQRFTSEERFAFWRAYGKKCYLCSRPLTLREVRLDHIVPERVDLARWAPLRERLGVPETFDLASYENIGAACDACNGDKSDALVPEGILCVMLEKAKTRAERTRTLLAEHKQRSREQLARFYLAQAARLDIEAKDLREAAMVAHTVTFPLNQAYLEQVLGLSVDDLDQASFEDLEHRALFEDGVAVPLIDSGNTIMEVATLADYRIARRGGFQPMGTVSIKAVSGIIQPFAAVLAVLKVARVPEHNLLSEHRVSIHSLDLIPATLFEACPVDERAQPAVAGESVADLVETGRAVIAGCASDFVDVTHECFHYRFVELMRADFDGDGSEEMLINLHVNAIGGTMGWTSLYILSRKDGDKLLSYRSYDPLAEGSQSP